MLSLLMFVVQNKNFSFNKQWKLQFRH